jgi:hypothetical protein
MIGVYQIDLQLGIAIPTNPLTQITISQSGFVSNVATLPVLLHPLVITTASVLPAGIQNQAYSLSFLATGGVTPYTWAVTSGTAPGGLFLDAAGLLSGTPTGTGSTFTVTVTDGVGGTSKGVFSLQINPPASTGSAGAASIGRKTGRANTKARGVSNRTAAIAQ